MKKFLKEYLFTLVLASSQIYLIVLKLIGYSELSWWLIFSPIIMLGVTFAVAFIIFAIVTFFTPFEDITHED